GGLGPLTEAEQRIIDELETDLALDIVISLVAKTVAGLAVQANADHAAARAVGFENAEHDLLTFLASDWFDVIVDGIQAEGRSGRTSLECAQAVVDAVWGPGVLEAVEVTPREPVCRHGKPPHGYEYLAPVADAAEPGTDIIEVYEARIRAEQERPDLIVLELPGCTLAIEVSDGHTLCDT
ncbi:MAG: hypothetical protein GWN58_25730, partial [Anaerolineae bacterium]|nr:hypothetical protein [Anaerolineae bacterium]